MVSSVSSLLNSYLATHFSEVGDRLALPLVQSPFAPAQAIVATIQSEGAKLNEQRLQDGKQQQAQQQTRERTQSLADYARPQLALLPSDEAELFASATLDPADAAADPVVVTLSSFVSDETNRARREALRQEDRESLSELLLKRAQQSVATLYARNNNAVYNVTPLFYEAA